MSKYFTALGCLLAVTLSARADVGDPQVGTDHPWYPGELACSTFDRLFATQAALYKRATGRDVTTDEDKALASWYWRNLNYWHAEEGAEDLWGAGFTAGGAMETRDYWTGLFAHGFGLCGTTHCQWAAEFERLLGHNRSRAAGVPGHSSHEVYLAGGPYGAGKWVLLDHDIGTVVFTADGSALASIPELRDDLRRLSRRDFNPRRQRGWPMWSYFDGHWKAFERHESVAYLAGYAGPPPMVHLRRGETLRRHLKPGLDDGKTFVFWGHNYMTGGVPGPERWGAWVNQPERMYGAAAGAGYHEGQARYANAVYTYTPDFAGGDYKEGVVEEAADRVVFEFRTPYIIAATPPDATPWGVYKRGGTNGLVLRGAAACPVGVSVDRGRTWVDAGPFRDGLDLTDHVKGYRQYLLRLGAGAGALAGSGLAIRTVCQTSPTTIPRLKDGSTRVSFAATHRSVVSAGPTREQAKTHLVDGAWETPSVTLELTPPRKAAAATVYAAAHALSYNPPNPRTNYRIDYSTDGGTTWEAVVADWKITRRGYEPAGAVWSQSFSWGEAPVAGAPVRVRFSNDGRIGYLRAEAHLAYRTAGRDGTRVTFDWADDTGPHQQAHVFAATGAPAWDVKTGKNSVTRWVEYEVVAAK